MADSDCIFCQILAGQAPGSFVYEDEHTAAFMDINQTGPYKVLVVPRAHAPTIYDLTPHQAATVMQTTVTVARALRDLTGCPGMNIFQNNGVIALQTVFHFHFHLQPRFEDDGFFNKLRSGQHDFPPREELDRMAAEIRATLAAE